MVMIGSSNRPVINPLDKTPTEFQKIESPQINGKGQ